MAYVDNLPRVSHIVSSVYPFDGEAKKRFESWLSSKQIAIDIYMNVANSYGTAIHKGMEDYINGKEGNINDALSTTYEPQLTEYVGYGIQFLKENNVTPVSVETYILVENTYQGTIDLIGEIDGERWVLDWKTFGIAQEILKTKSASWKWRKPYEKLSKATLQLSLYALPLGIKNIGIIELAADGYHFHKLKIMTQEEVTTIVNNYHLGTTTNNVQSVEVKM